MPHYAHEPVTELRIPALAPRIYEDVSVVALGDDTYRVEEIPRSLVGISQGDVIRATRELGQSVHRCEMVWKSPSRTIIIFPKRTNTGYADDGSTLRSELTRMRVRFTPSIFAEIIGVTVAPDDRVQDLIEMLDRLGHYWECADAGVVGGHSNAPALPYERYALRLQRGLAASGGGSLIARSRWIASQVLRSIHGP
jgi:hypothetical protein